MTSSFLRQTLLTVWLVVVLAPAAWAADPAFVGALALAVDEEGAQALGLSPDTLQKLQELIDQRETEALRLSREIRDLPPAEIAKRLEPFVAESERQGMELLTLEQREKLNQLKIARGGMSTLADDEVARVLALSDEQRQQVSDLMQQRAQDMTVGGENNRRLTQALYERKLISLLSPQQRASWEKLAGLGSGTLDTAADSENAAQAIASAATAEEGDETDEAAASDDQQANDERDGEPSNEDDGLMTFSFRQANWEDVLHWFADNAGLSMQIDRMPEGTFSYRDDQRYTPAEALDILNSVLLNQGYTLVRRGRMLMLLDLEEPLPPELVELVDVDELDERGAFELVKCVFHLARMTPEDAEAEINKLLGPGRTAVVLPQSRQVVVTDTVGNLRIIRDVIQSIENPDGARKKLRVWKLKHVLADDVLDVARPLIGLADGEFTNEQINIATDAFRTRIFATGQPAMLELLDEAIQSTDIEPDAVAGNATPAERAYIDTYPVHKADLQTVMDVLSQQLAGLPDVRMAADKTSNQIIVQGRAQDHETVKRLMTTLEGDARTVETIRVSTADPQLVVLAIKNLFGTSTEEGQTGGMRVDADPNSGLIMVYGTQDEHNRVRQLVEQMEGPKFGENENVRMIPLTQAQMEKVFPQLEAIWPSMSKSRIRFVVPNESSSGNPRFRERSIAPESSSSEAPRRRNAEQGERERPGRPRTSAPPDARLNRGQSMPLITARVPADGDYVQLISAPAIQEDDREAESAPSEAAAAPDPPDGATEPMDDLLQADSDQDAAAQEESLDDVQNQSAAETPETEQGDDLEGDSAEQEPINSDIVVTMTPNGLLVTSDDPKALDRFENLMRILVQQPGAGTGLLKRDVAVYYLRYVQAEVAANLLKDILGGTSTSSGGSITDMASNLIGGNAGGIFGALMGGGGGGGGSTTGPIKAGTVSIVADPRLNRLIVQGDANELDEIEQILQVIDKDESLIDILVSGSAHVIPLQYAAADKVAQIIQSAYNDRVAGGQGQGQGGQQRQPSPEDFFRMLRGGGGRGGNDDSARGELPKMTVTVDADNNAIIVRAPDSLVDEIKDLVAILDQPNSELSESIEVVALDSNGSLLYNALKNLTGSTTTAPAATTNNNNNNNNRGQQQSMEDAMRQMERFRQFRDQMGGGGGGGRRGGGGGGGNPFGGGRGGRGGRGN